MSLSVRFVLQQPKRNPHGADSNCFGLAKVLSVMAIIGSCLCLGPAAGDEIRIQLDAAKVEFEATIASLDSDVKEFLEKDLSRHQERGDFERAVDAQTRLEEFTTEGILQDLPSLQALRRRMQPKYRAAVRKYRSVQLRAIEDYTRAKDIEAAKGVKQSLDNFDETDILAKRFPTNPPPVGKPVDDPPLAEKPKLEEINLTGTWMVKYPNYVVSRPYELLDLGTKVLISSEGHAGTGLISSRGELTWDREHLACSGTVEEEFVGSRGKHRATIRAEVIDENTLKVLDYWINFNTGQKTNITVYYHRK